MRTGRTWRSRSRYSSHAEEGDIVHLLPALPEPTNGFENRLPYRCRTVRSSSNGFSQTTRV
jgi:hypothetical protein